MTGSNLVGFPDNSRAVNFRPWAPVHASIAQMNTFAPAPNMSLSSDKEDMSAGEMVFMRSCKPGHVPSFFRGSYREVPYNIDRAARHMGFDQGVPLVRQPVVPEDSLPTVLDASALVSGKSLPFLLAERNPSTTSKYNIFW